MIGSESDTSVSGPYWWFIGQKHKYHKNTISFICYMLARKWSKCIKLGMVYVCVYAYQAKIPT